MIEDIVEFGFVSRQNGSNAQLLIADPVRRNPVLPRREKRPMPARPICGSVIQHVGATAPACRSLRSAAGDAGADVL